MSAGRVVGHRWFYWNNAKQAASELVFGTEVTLQIFSHNKYGRTIADVLLLDDTNILIN